MWGESYFSDCKVITSKIQIGPESSDNLGPLSTKLVLKKIYIFVSKRYHPVPYTENIHYIIPDIDLCCLTMYNMLISLHAKLPNNNVSYENVKEDMMNMTWCMPFIGCTFFSSNRHTSGHTSTTTRLIS